jgi:DNA-binding beta-propeller fold protein YncE
MGEFGRALLLAVGIAWGAPAIALAEGSVYVTDQGMFFNGGQGSAVWQFDIGAGDLLTPKTPPSTTAGLGPVGVAISPDARSVYVANSRSATVSQFDVGAGGRLSAKSPDSVAGPAGGGPYQVAVSPDGRGVYVINGAGNSVSQFDVGAGGRLASKTPATVPVAGPDDLVVSPDGTSVYVTNLNGDTVSQFDVAPNGTLSPKPVAQVAADQGPAGLAIAPDGKSVYVANGRAGTVSQFDVGPGGALAPKVPAAVAVGASPVAVAVSPDGRSAYVSTSSTGGIYQFDISDRGLLRPKSQPLVPLGNPGTVAFTANGRSAYVTYNEGVAQFDVAPGGLLAPKNPPRVAAGTAPVGLAVLPDQPPIAMFSASPARAGAATRFDARAARDPDGAIATYAWSFGDGTSTASAGATPVHVYRRPGRYQVRLALVDDAGCSTTTVFTGHTATCAGGPGASASRTITVPSARCLVPRLVHRTLAAARRVLRRANCRLGRVTRRRSASVPRGRIISQRPAPHRRVAVRTQVAVVVSGGH